MRPWRTLLLRLDNALLMMSSDHWSELVCQSIRDHCMQTWCSAACHIGSMVVSQSLTRVSSRNIVFTSHAGYLVRILTWNQVSIRLILPDFLRNGEMFHRDTLYFTHTHTKTVMIPSELGLDSSEEEPNELEEEMGILSVVDQRAQGSLSTIRFLRPRIPASWGQVPRAYCWESTSGRFWCITSLQQWQACR